ncbi:TolC family protein [Cytophagaceae bacterium BD1B2-1]|uniref:TolC family protein n=1 Tax=Xanthocytophaga agilis TaxID=3048010 RepID=A0AAE3UIG4_9BACT|nr:TolC family protein [Xanthocytophaga agilis]
MLGLSVQESLVLHETLSDPASQAVSLQSSSHPEVKLAHAQSMLAHSAWKASKASFTPILSAVYQWNTQISGDELLKFGNANTLPQQYWGLRLSIPILVGSSRLFQIQKSHIDWEFKQKNYQAIRKQADLDDENLRLAYDNAVSALGKSRQIMDLYHQNDQHASRQLNEGVLSLDERLRYFSDYISGQNDYLTNLSEYLIQHYRIQIQNKVF